MDDDFDDDFDGGFEDDELDGDAEALDQHEASLVVQDLADLADFEAAFAPEGYRGVAVFCQDCVEDHFYPWEMLRENLELLLETGDIPVHEPAFAPEPHRYVPWDYARGYVDALRDLGASDRTPLDRCARCGFVLPSEVSQANFCPRCGTATLTQRLHEVLLDLGLTEQDTAAILRATGLPVRDGGPPPPTEPDEDAADR